MDKHISLCGQVPVVEGRSCCAGARWRHFKLLSRQRPTFIIYFFSICPSVKKVFLSGRVSYTAQIVNELCDL